MLLPKYCSLQSLKSNAGYMRPAKPVSKQAF